MATAEAVANQTLSFRKIGGGTKETVSRTGRSCRTVGPLRRTVGDQLAAAEAHGNGLEDGVQARDRLG